MQIGTSSAVSFALGYLAYSFTNAALYLGHRLFVSKPLAEPYNNSSTINPSTNSNSDGRVLKQDSTALKEITGLSSAEYVAAAETQPNLMSAEQSYARVFDADTSTLRVSCIFTAQACQKMLLQEATRCVPDRCCDR
jgi:hypothetical protein